MKWKTILIIITILNISNLPIINKNILLVADGQNPFRYSNSNASYTKEDTFGFKDLFINDWSINRFIEEARPSKENQQIFRLYKINPLCFWRWSYYISISRKFPYKSWDEIEPKRVPFDAENMWQEF
ncbi:hypothetical protein [Sphingobacterium endophyticum]|uniref:hypothetical protein n=1 Tax=Sphingobacterium endophyticum TaxID=2546448 RepID=UPI0012E2455D|nr:hypothetical protein [Sphingobacterium endophyticum]